MPSPISHSPRKLLTATKQGCQDQDEQQVPQRGAGCEVEGATMARTLFLATATASSIQSCTHFVALMCSVALPFSSPFSFFTVYLFWFLSLPLSLSLALSSWWLFVTLLVLFLGQLFFRRLLVLVKL